MPKTHAPVVIATAGGLSVSQSAGGRAPPFTVAENGLGIPVTVIESGGVPMHLLNLDGTDWESGFEPVQASPPIGTATSDTTGNFTFVAPPSVSPITSSEFRYSLDELDWTVLTDPFQPVLLTGIDFETTVYAQVRFLNGAGWSEWSTSGEFTTLEEIIPPYPPAQPDAPIGASTGTDSGTFTFVEPDDDGGSAIIEAELRWNDNVGDWTVIADAVSPEALTGLDPDATIFGQVRFLNGVDWSEWSDTGSFTTDAEAPPITVPAAPVAPVGLATGHDTGTFTWEYPFDGGAAITDEEFETSLDEVDWDPVVDPTSPVDLTGLTPETDYFGRVRVMNSEGWSDWSASGSFLTEVEPQVPATPSAPTGAATGPTSGTFTFSEPVDTGTSAIVASQLRHSLDESAWTTVDDPESPYAVLGQPDDTLVYGQVRFQNSTGWSEWSTSGTFTTEVDATVPATPLPPEVTVTGPTTATATFVEPDDGGAAIDDVELRISDDEATWSTIADPVSPEDLTGLDSSTVYYLQVRFHNSEGWSEWSVSESFETETATAPVWVPDGAAMALEFDNDRHWLGGTEYTNATVPIDFERSTATTWHLFGTTTLDDMSVDEPRIDADGIWLRAAVAQLINNPVTPASWSVSNSGTIAAAAAGDTWSSLSPRSIHSGGNVNSRAHSGNPGVGFAAGSTYFLMWIYRRVPASESDGTNVGSNAVRLSVTTSVSTSSIGISSSGVVTTTEPGGTFANIQHYVLDPTSGLEVRMTTAEFTAITGSNGTTGSVGIGPNSSSSGTWCIAYGVNAWPGTAQQRFTTYTHTRAAESIGPGLATAEYDFTVVAPDDDEEDHLDYAWTSGDRIGAGSVEFGPLSGDRQIKRIYAYGDSTTAPATPDAPVGAVVSDTSGTFTFTAPSDGGSAITASELRYSDDEATWTTISDPVSPRLLTGLDASTEYFGQTRFQNAVGWSGWSASGSFTTADPPPEGVFSIWGFERPETAPTTFPGSLIPVDEQDAGVSTRWTRQSNDAALSIAEGNLAASGAQSSARYIAYTPATDLVSGHRIAILAKTEALSGNFTITTSNGSTGVSNTPRLGWKQGVRTLTAGGQIGLRAQFAAGVAGNFSEMRAYDLTELLAQPWIVICTAGQSNGVGATCIADPDIETPIEGVVVFPGANNTYTGSVAGAPMIAVDPINHQTLNGSSSAYGGGIAGSYLREMRKIIPANYTLVFVALNYAGQGFKQNGLWNKETLPTPTAYNGFWSNLDAVMAAAPDGSHLGGLIFCGGESDLGSGNEAEWQSPTTGVPNLINEVRTAYGDDVPVIITEIGMDPTQSNVASMIALQQKLATGSGDALEFPLCAYVSRPTGWATSDGTHYVQATHRLQGPRISQAWHDLIYTGAPPPAEDGIGAMAIGSTFEVA